MHSPTFDEKAMGMMVSTYAAAWLKLKSNSTFVAAIAKTKCGSIFTPAPAIDKSLRA